MRLNLPEIIIINRKSNKIQGSGFPANDTQVTIVFSSAKNPHCRYKTILGNQQLCSTEVGDMVLVKVLAGAKGKERAV